MATREGDGGEGEGEEEGESASEEESGWKEKKNQGMEYTRCQGKNVSSVVYFSQGSETFCSMTKFLPARPCSSVPFAPRSRYPSAWSRPGPPRPRSASPSPSSSCRPPRCSCCTGRANTAFHGGSPGRTGPGEGRGGREKHENVIVRRSQKGPKVLVNCKKYGRYC